MITGNGDGRIGGLSGGANQIDQTGLQQGFATVQEGETDLSEVAKRLGVSEPALKEANPQITDPTKLQAGQDLKLPEAKPSEPPPESSTIELQENIPESDSKARIGELNFKGSYVEANLRSQVNQASPTQKSGPLLSFVGMRVGKANGADVNIKREISPPGGHDERLQAVAYARLSGAENTAIVQDQKGKWHAVETTGSLPQGVSSAADPKFKAAEGLASISPGSIAKLDKEIQTAQQKGDYKEVERLQILRASVILGVPVTEIKIIASSRDREAGKINISTDKGGGMHGAEKSPNTNFDPKLKSAIEIGMSSLDDTKRAATILNHEMSHAKDYELTQKWVKQYEKDTGQTFQPGKFGDQNFTVWINKQAPKMISRADAELVSDVSANANGSSEAKAYIGSFIAALKAGSPEAAANELRNYAAGMTSKPQKINRPTGAHVELEMKRLLETEYKKMPKEMKEAFDKTFAELKQKYPDAWISKFNHATALK